jgi:hypothetical protein
MPVLERRHFGALLGAGIPIAFLSGRALDTYSRIECPIRTFVGIECPGCGSTRCLTAFSKGDLVVAARSNPLLFAMLAGLLFYCAFGLVMPSRGRNVLDYLKVMRVQFTILTLLVLTVFTAIRNIAF